MGEEVGYYTTVAADPGPVFALLLSSPLRSLLNIVINPQKPFQS